MGQWWVAKQTNIGLKMIGYNDWTEKEWKIGQFPKLTLKDLQKGLVSTCGCCCCFLLKGLGTLLDLKELNLADNIIEKIGMFSE